MFFYEIFQGRIFKRNFFKKNFCTRASCTKITNGLTNVHAKVQFSPAKGIESHALTSRRAWQEDTVIRWITISSDCSGRYCELSCLYCELLNRVTEEKKRNWRWIIKELFYCHFNVLKYRAWFNGLRNNFSTLWSLRKNKF